MLFINTSLCPPKAGDATDASTDTVVHIMLRRRTVISVGDMNGYVVLTLKARTVDFHPVEGWSRMMKRKRRW